VIKVVIVLIVILATMTLVKANQKVWVSCAQVRQSVAVYGLEAVEQFARQRGVSEQDLRRARIACLRG